MPKHLLIALSPFGVAMAVASGLAHAQPDPLASWNDGAAKRRIVAFVKAATEPGGKVFVAAAVGRGQHEGRRADRPRAAALTDTRAASQR